MYFIKKSLPARGGPHRFHKVTKYACTALRYVALAATALGIFALVFIVLFVIGNGMPHITKDLLFGKYTLSGAPTILPSLATTGLVILLTSIIAFPLGICAALFLVEYVKKGNKLVGIIRVSVETLGGIPSIVYGLFGMIFFCKICGFGLSILSGCLTISIMLIPTTVRAVEEALKSVPDGYREGAFALGAGKLRTIYKVVIPSALPGILAAVILGIGRMCSESAPFMFTSGASLRGMPAKGYRGPGTTLAVGLYAMVNFEGKYMNEAYATACVLILIVLLLNVISTILVSLLQRKLLGTAKRRGTKQ